MASINLPFAATGDRRPPNSGELSAGFPCGPADQDLFNWLMWWGLGQTDGVIEKSGLTTDDADLYQLAKAVRSQKLNTGTLGGTANALTLTLDPAPSAYADLLLTPIRVLNTVGGNTVTAPTINVNALGVKTIKRLTGGALAASDTLGLLEIAYDGTDFRIISQVGLPSSAASTQSAPKLVGIIANGSGAGTSIPNSVATRVNFTVTEQNNLGTSTWDAGGHTLTVGTGEAGLWLVTATAHFGPPVGGTFSSMEILRSGSSEGYGSSTAGNVGDGAAPSVSAILKCAAGNTIEAFAYQQTGSSQSVLAGARTRFAAFLISAY